MRRCSLLLAAACCSCGSSASLLRAAPLTKWLASRGGSAFVAVATKDGLRGLVATAATCLLVTCS